MKPFRRVLIASTVATAALLVLFLLANFSTFFGPTYQDKTLIGWIRELQREDPSWDEIVQALDHFHEETVSREIRNSFVGSSMFASATYRKAWDKSPQILRRYIREPFERNLFLDNLLTVLPMLCDKHKEAATPHIIEALNDSSEYVRLNSMTCLSALEVEVDAATQALLEVVRTAPANDAITAAGCLRRIAPNSAELVTLLINRLQTHQGRYRPYFVLSLGEMGNVAEPAVVSLRSLQDEADMELALAIEEALSKIQGDGTSPWE